MCIGSTVYDVLSQLKNACDLMWFTQNYMQADTEELQLILFSSHEASGSLNVRGTAINSEPVVKLLGLSCDRDLSFSDHITLLCQKDHDQ